MLKSPFSLSLVLFTLASSLPNASAYLPPEPAKIKAPGERESIYLRTIDQLEKIAWKPARILGPASMLDFAEAKVIEDTLVPFWRTRVMPDQWLQKAAWGYSTNDRIFDLLEKESDRLYTHVPHNSIGADTISAVRLLGGWKHPKPVASNDLAYRKADGSLAYRWELLHKRIDPIVSNGLTPLMVLDNVPYALAPDDAGTGSTYGQNLAPTDFKEWEDFIEAFCRELADRYGAERAAAWRFRIGTEADNPNHWERRAPDSLEKYLKTYDHAAAAIKRVFPDARIGPSNFNSMFAGEFHRSVNPKAVMKHFATGTNYATGKRAARLISSPYLFMAFINQAAHSITRTPPNMATALRHFVCTPDTFRSYATSTRNLLAFLWKFRNTAPYTTKRPK